MLSGRWFFVGCAAVAGLALVVGRAVPIPVWFLGVEVLGTVLGLFLLGSFSYQIHKNALTYGMALIVTATFAGCATRRGTSKSPSSGWAAWTQRTRALVCTGLDELVHADTMLFILGLTLFVSVIAQTRLLEGVTFVLLRRNRGAILPTVIAVTAVVAFASGILDGVSMIGLTIRTLVIILLLAAAPIDGDPVRGDGLHDGHDDLRHLAGLRRAAQSDHEGQPAPVPRQRLLPAVLRAPARRQLPRDRVAAPSSGSADRRIDLDDHGRARRPRRDVRFLQATRHGEVLTPVELIEDHAAEIAEPHGPAFSRACARASRSASPWSARTVPEPIRKMLLGHFVTEDLADSLDRHYVLDAAGDHEAALEAERAVDKVDRRHGDAPPDAQRIGALGCLPSSGCSGCTASTTGAAVPRVVRRVRCRPARRS